VIPAPPEVDSLEPEELETMLEEIRAAEFEGKGAAPEDAP